MHTIEWREKTGEGGGENGDRGGEEISIPSVGRRLGFLSRLKSVTAPEGGRIPRGANCGGGLRLNYLQLN